MVREPEDRRGARGPGRRHLHGHRPRAEHRALRGPARDWTRTATSSRTAAPPPPACPACSPRATWPTTATARPSPRPAAAAWPRSTPSASSRAARCPALRILFLAPQPFFEVRGTPLAVLHMIAGPGRARPPGRPADVPAGRAGAVPRACATCAACGCRSGRVKAGPSLAKMALDVPFLAEAVWRLRFGRYDVVHAVEEAAHLIAPVRAAASACPLVMDVDSSIPDQLRYSGFATARAAPLARPRPLERHALRHSAAAVTVCASLTDGREGPRARTCPSSRSRTRRSWTRGAAPVARGRGRAAPRAGPRPLAGRPLLRATSSPTRASSCCSTPWPSCPTPSCC